MKKHNQKQALSPILKDNPNSPNRHIQGPKLLMVGRRNDKGGATAKDLANEITFALKVLVENRLVQEHEGRYLLTSKGKGVLEKVRQPSYVKTADVTDGIWWNSECNEPVIVRDRAVRYFVFRRAQVVRGRSNV